MYLGFWSWYMSEATAGGYNRQEVNVKPSASLQTIDPFSIPLLRKTSDERAWSYQVIDLGQYAGKSIDLAFEVYTDGSGSRTVMFIDDVTILACRDGHEFPISASRPAPLVEIASVGNLNPPGNIPQAIGKTNKIQISIDVIAPGYTEMVGEDPKIWCVLSLGKVETFGGVWLEVGNSSMAYHEDRATGDRYRGEIGAIPEGKYEYTAGCTYGDSLATVWADVSAGGGYGKLTVFPF